MRKSLLRRGLLRKLSPLISEEIVEWWDAVEVSCVDSDLLRSCRCILNGEDRVVGTGASKFAGIARLDVSRQ